MKLFRIFFSFFIVAALVFIASLFFPGTYRIERKVNIHKPVGEVYHFMNDFKNWEKWSLWNKTTDSTLVYFYGKRSDSTGGRQYFQGELLGIGRFRFDETTPDKYLVYNLYMHGGEVNARGTFLFSGNGTQTELTWLDSGDVGYNPIFRFMIPAKVSATEKTFDDGLNRIKQILEK